MYVLVSKAIRRHFGQNSTKASLLISIMLLLIEEAYVQHSGAVFVQEVGLTTGLAAAGTLANIFLSCDFDRHAMEVTGARVFARYLDDGCGICKAISSEFLAERLSEWHPSIQVKESDVQMGRSVHFLDLQIDVCEADGSLLMETFRKPQGIWDYVPMSSAHHPSIFRGVVHTETNRLLMTNNTEKCFEKNVAFFVNKLIKRGYCPRMIEEIRKKYPFERRWARLLPRRKKENGRAIIIPTTFAIGLRCGKLKHAMRSARIVASMKDTDIQLVHNGEEFIPIDSPKNLGRLINSVVGREGPIFL